jgi:hypothetical protein
MYAILLVLSIVSTAIGIFAIGFGIPYQAFNLGNTLFVCGAVAIVGGMVTFGLAVAVRQLRRIADALGPRPAAAPAPRRQSAPESVEGAPATRRGPPPYPQRPDAREVRPAPPPPAPAPMMEAPEPPPPPMERPRPNIFGVARGPGEPPMMEEPETVPLAPSRPPAASSGRAGPPPRPERMPEPRPEPEPMPERMSDPMPEPRPAPALDPRTASPADIMARLANLASTPARPAPPPRPEPRPLPASERPPEPRQNMFDALWPVDARRQSQSETIARAPKSEGRPEPRPDARPEPKVDIREPRLDMRPEPKPDLRFEPPMPRERNEPPPREPMMPPPPERPIAILKSGVIDGMAYTLYTDGSIEAELPQGTMRFGSIDELRAHLENTERQD